MREALSPEDFACEPTLQGGDLELLNTQIDEAAELVEAIEQLEADLKASKLRLHGLQTKTIPDQMHGMGIEQLTRNGWAVQISQFFHGSIPSKDPDKREAAFAYLIELGADGIIKTEVSVEFSKGHFQDAIELQKRLIAEEIPAELDRNVHPQTLIAFVREALRNGDAIEPEKLGVNTGPIAKFKKV